MGTGSGFQQLGFVSGSEFRNLFTYFLLLVRSEFGRRRGSGGQGYSDLAKEIFLASGRADAQESRWSIGFVLELMRSISGDVDGDADADGRALVTNSGFDFALEDGKRFFKVVAMRGRAASGWDVHVDEAVLSRGVFSRKKDGVSVSNDAEVRLIGAVGLSEGRGSLGVVCRDAHNNIFELP
jgi:hypothetical protein